MKRDKFENTSKKKCLKNFPSLNKGRKGETWVIESTLKACSFEFCVSLKYQTIKFQTSPN